MTLDLERATRKHLGNYGEEYVVFFNSYSSNKREIALLIKDNAPVTDLKWENVIPGNFSKLSMVVKGMKILLKFIYAPNEDSIPNDLEN